MKRLWYAFWLSTRGVAECLSLASSLGVTDLTLPAFDNEPCDGIFSLPFLCLNNSIGEVFIKVHNLGAKDISWSRSFSVCKAVNGCAV
jgi:hypothetical protein